MVTFVQEVHCCYDARCWQDEGLVLYFDEKLVDFTLGPMHNEGGLACKVILQTLLYWLVNLHN